MLAALAMATFALIAWLAAILGFSLSTLAADAQKKGTEQQSSILDSTVAFSISAQSVAIGFYYVSDEDANLAIPEGTYTETAGQVLTHLAELKHWYAWRDPRHSLKNDIDPA